MACFSPSSSSMSPMKVAKPEASHSQIPIGSVSGQNTWSYFSGHWYT